MDPVVVRPVWMDNFPAETTVFYKVAPRARHVALNVQFPGCVVRGGGGAAPTVVQRYDVIRVNVNLLKPLQVGLAICTDDGRRYVWEFNLQGYEINNPEEEGDAQSIVYLWNRGLEFNRLSRSGIPGFRLRWMLRTSGLFRAGPSWATFTGAYHLAYFAHIIFGELPVDVGAFMEKVSELLGSVYDVKLVAREEGGLVGSLEKVAQQLGVVVPPNGFGGLQLAGSGSMRTLLSFEALKAQTPDGDVEKHRNSLCGLHAN